MRRFLPHQRSVIRRVAGPLLVVLVAWWLSAEPAGGVEPLRVDPRVAASEQAGSRKVARRRPLPTETGQWWHYRGSRRMAGRVPLAGRITKPVIRWQHALAARQTLLAASLVPGAGEATVALPVVDVSASDWGATLSAWGVSGPWVDLDGNGSRAPLPSGINSKAGRILPNHGQWQLVKTTPKNYPESQPYLGTVSLQLRDNGKWVPKWETETDTLIWSAEPIFGDFDHDGRPEIACLPWYKLNLFDAETGQLEAQCHYLHQGENPGVGGRAYGWFGAFDVDGKGRDEFVILDDFTKHMEVLGWREGKLERLWSRRLRTEKTGSLKDATPGLEQKIALRVNPAPVQDVDGDGQRDIVVSTYNLAADQKWHIWVLDALTGKLRWDLEGMYLSGLGDTDGDGIAELFCTRVQQGLRIPAPADLALYSLADGTRSVRWQQQNASWQTYHVPQYPDHVNSGASLGAETVLCGPVASGQRNVFFTRAFVDPAMEVTEVTAWQVAEDQQLRPIGSMRGPRLEVQGLRIRPDGGRTVLLSVSAFTGQHATVTCMDATAEVVHSRRIAAPACPVVVGRLTPGAAPTVIVQGANETVEAIRPATDGSVDVRWRVPGRGMTNNNFFEGLLLADLVGDGSLSTVVGSRGTGDCARLKVLSPTGKVVWTRDFESFPGTPPPWNVPGLMYWQGGYFNAPDRMDLVVQLRVLGGLSYLIDGRDGTTIWRREKSVPGRTFGRNLMTIYDFDGDGLEDVLNTFPDLFCVAQGKTGQLLVAERAGEFVPGNGYYGTAIVADLLGKGEDQLLFSSGDVMALLKRDGQRIWHGKYGAGSRVRAGIGDAAGDGEMELFLIAEADGKRLFQCQHAASGQLRWSLALPGGIKPTDPATADIDGDGREECLFTIGQTLYAVGADAEGRSGKIEWSLSLPGQLSAVTVADVAGDGTLQIVVSCADGVVYGIGSVAPSR